MSRGQGLRNRESAVSRGSLRRLINLPVPGIKCLHATHTNKNRLEAVSANRNSPQVVGDLLFTLTHTDGKRVSSENQSQQGVKELKQCLS